MLNHCRYYQVGEFFSNLYSSGLFSNQEFWAFCRGEFPDPEPPFLGWPTNLPKFNIPTSFVRNPSLTHLNCLTCRFGLNENWLMEWRSKPRQKLCFKISPTHTLKNTPHPFTNIFWRIFCCGGFGKNLGYFPGVCRQNHWCMWFPAIRNLRRNQSHWPGLLNWVALVWQLSLQIDDLHLHRKKIRHWKRKHLKATTEKKRSWYGVFWVWFKYGACVKYIYKWK